MQQQFFVACVVVCETNNLSGVSTTYVNFEAAVHPAQMAESLNAHQRDRILELGAWRDQGHRFAVGLHGEVHKHEEHAKDNDNGSGQWQEAAASASSGPSSTSGPPAAPGSEPGSAERRKSIIEDYKAHLSEVRRYFHVTLVETEEGIWLIVPMWPIGKPGPRFTVALYLPPTIDVTPTAFGFRSSGQLARAIGKRHTNSPEGSICAWSDGDIEWAPGDSPFLLLRLYAEWLLCQLFYQSEGYWPGSQSGMVGAEAVYRWNEFDPREWCDCGSQKRYGNCHQFSDAAIIASLKARGKSVAPPLREIPPSVLTFARSDWRKVPPASDLPLRIFTMA